MRRRYTADDRARLVAEARSGNSVREVAERHGMSPSLLYRWMQQPAKGRGPVFARLAVSKLYVESAVVVQVRQASIRVEKGFDSELLREVVAALEGLQ
jgi:transposase-like protein